MPETNRLHSEYADQGLVLIGVHTTRGGEKMAAYVEENVEFPVCLDTESATTGAFRVDSYPDYYLIDRAGKLRVADLANSDLERAIGVLLAEPAPEPANRGEAIARDFPRAAFQILSEGESVGTWTMRNRVVEHEGNRVLEMVDELTMRWQGRELSARFRTLCNVEGNLAPLAFELTGGDGEELSPFEVRFTDGEAIVSKEDRELTREIPDGTIPTTALLRLVTRLPFEEGAELSFHSLEIEEMNLKRDHLVRCAGAEEIEIGGTPRRAWRYVHTGSAINTATYWVGEGRTLLRFKYDDEVFEQIEPAPVGRDLK